MASSSNKVIIAALIGNSLIAITKFIASVITGSSAMFAEGIHSLVDTGNQGLLLYGIKQAGRPADSNHPYGYGKEVYFWSFVVAILIFAVGAGISVYEGVIHIIHPVEIKNPTINYIVLSLAIIFEGGAFFFAVKEFRKVKGSLGYIEAVKKGKDPSIFVVLFEDSAALLGLLVAFAGIYIGQVTGNLVFDGIATVLIGLLLAFAAIFLAIETKGLLIGEAANPEIIEATKSMALALTSIKKINEVLTLHMGPDYVLVNISADFHNNMAVNTIEDEIAMLDRQIKQQFPVIKRLYVEAESRSRDPTDNL